MKTTAETRFWVNIVSLDHVEKGVAGGFVQASHGDKEGLEALSRGDYVAFYSPRTRFRKGKPLQEFTALGLVEDGEPHRVDGSAKGLWQCHMNFLDANQTPIQPLVNDLVFIPDKERWGLPFNKGLFEIERADFSCIAKAMGLPEFANL
jgi:hypothetical protein